MGGGRDPGEVELQDVGVEELAAGGRGVNEGGLRGQPQPRVRAVGPRAPEGDHRLGRRWLPLPPPNHPRTEKSGLDPDFFAALLSLFQCKYKMAPF